MRRIHRRRPRNRSKVNERRGGTRGFHAGELSEFGRIQYKRGLVRVFGIGRGEPSFDGDQLGGSRFGMTAGAGAFGTTTLGSDVMIAQRFDRVWGELGSQSHCAQGRGSTLETTTPAGSPLSAHQCIGLTIGAEESGMYLLVV